MMPSLVVSAQDEWILRADEIEVVEHLGGLGVPGLARRRGAGRASRPGAVCGGCRARERAGIIEAGRGLCRREMGIDAIRRGLSRRAAKSDKS